MCMWGINMGAYNKVSDTMDQFIHMRFFLVVNIRMMTYGVFFYFHPKYYKLNIGLY